MWRTHTHTHSPLNNNTIPLTNTHCISHTACKRWASTKSSISHSWSLFSFFIMLYWSAWCPSCYNTLSSASPSSSCFFFISLSFPTPPRPPPLYFPLGVTHAGCTALRSELFSFSSYPWRFCGHEPFGCFSWIHRKKRIFGVNSKLPCMGSLFRGVSYIIVFFQPDTERC